MQKHEVRSEAAALAYLVDCTMATVAHLAMRKSRPKHEYSRQISIAQVGYDWCRGFNAPISTTRMQDLAEHSHSVEAWARTYEPKVTP